MQLIQNSHLWISKHTPNWGVRSEYLSGVGGSSVCVLFLLVDE